MTANICLVTAVTDDFLPGAIAMLGSFRSHHPGFNGDVIVLHDGLTEESCAVLEAVAPLVRFQPVAPELLDRVAHLKAAYPNRPILPPMFHALDAFRLDGYRKVLYYDSDMLFLAPVDELFDTDEALLCCGDRQFVLNRQLDPDTGLALQGRTDRPVLERPFNAGFMLIDGACAGPRVYADLLALMVPEVWRNLNIRLTDQPIVNRYFAGRQTLTSWTYNYFVPEAAEVRERTSLNAELAKVLHFKGPVKPWAPDAMLRWAHGGAELAYRTPATLFKLWYDAYLEVLAKLHLRTAYPALAKGPKPPNHVQHLTEPSRLD